VVAANAVKDMKGIESNLVEVAIIFPPWFSQKNRERMAEGYILSGN